MFDLDDIKDIKLESRLITMMEWKDNEEINIFINIFDWWLIKWVHKGGYYTYDLGKVTCMHNWN